MERIDLPAGTVHYRVFGPADGRPVVFVHGFLVDTDLWSDVPERLAEAGYRASRRPGRSVRTRRRCTTARTSRRGASPRS